MKKFFALGLISCFLGVNISQATPVEELVDAIVSGDWQNVQRLRCHEHDLYAQRGASILHLAAQENRLALVKQLINQLRVDINREGGPQIRHVTPLSLAAQRGHRRIVECLLQAGARLDGRLVTPLHDAAAAGHADIVRLLVRAGADVNARDIVGCTSIMNACYCGKLDVVVALAKHVNVNELGGQGCTPLFCAAQTGHPAVIQFLTDYTNIQVGLTGNASRTTPLIVAAARGHTEAVKLLIDATRRAEGGDIDYAQLDGVTALHAAAQGGHLTTVKLLLDAGADTKKKNTQGATSLHFASLGGNPEIVTLLLRWDRTLDINAAAPGGLGHTALHLAAHHGHFDVVRVLKDAGADVTRRDNAGNTPADVARANGHDEIVAYLES